MISLLNGSSVSLLSTNVPSQLLQLPSAARALKTTPKWLLGLSTYSLYFSPFLKGTMDFLLAYLVRQPWLGDSHSFSVALPPADRLDTHRCPLCSIWEHWLKSKKSFSSLHQKCCILNKSRSTEKLVIPNKLLHCTSKYNFSPGFSLCTLLCAVPVNTG